MVATVRRHQTRRTDVSVDHVMGVEDATQVYIRTYLLF